MEFSKKAYWHKRAGEKLVSLAKQAAFDFEELIHRLEWAEFDTVAVKAKIKAISDQFEDLAGEIEKLFPKEENDRTTSSDNSSTTGIGVSKAGK